MTPPAGDTYNTPPTDRAKLRLLGEPQIVITDVPVVPEAGQAEARPLLPRTTEALVFVSSVHDPAIRAYVWDTPLLLETHLNKHCDAVVFVGAPREVRLERLKGRGWDEAELSRREKSQMPLDNKAKLSHYSIANPAGAGDANRVRSQVREVLSRILERTAAPG